MGRLTVGQKAARVTQFLVGLRNRRVASALARAGFGKEDLKEGWTRLSELTSGRLDVVLPDGDPKLIDQLDAWENEWFPVADASLRARFPEIHKYLFNNLVQTEGVEVITSVSTFLARLDRVTKSAADGGLGADGDKARALLVKRGITDEVVGDARKILKQLGQVEKLETPGDLDEEEDARREKAMWDWYLEWSQITRVKVKNRRLLRALGFLRPDGTQVEDEEDVTDPNLTPVPGPVPPVQP